MLRFEPQYMRECINDGSDQVMMQYCTLCLYELNRLNNKRTQQRNDQNTQISQPWFILRTISQLSALFKNKTQSPILKFKATKLLTYLLLINEPQIYHKFQLQLYPLVKNICLYNKSQRIQQRGIDYFKNNKYYQMGNIQEKQKIKQIGVKFLIYCLQLVLVMNKWWRVDQIDRMEITVYGKGYDALLKQGVKFMEEEDMIFWGESKISQVIKNINKCTNLVNEKRFNIKSTGLYKHNINNVSNLSNTSVSASYTENPQRLNKQVQQKDDVINQLRMELDNVRRQKQGIVGEFSRQRLQWEKRVQECERRLRQMKGVVRVVKKKLNRYQQNNNINNNDKNKQHHLQQSQQQDDYESMLFSTQQSQPSFIQQMRQSIKLLISQNLKLQQQNLRLKQQLKSLQQKMQKQLRKKKNVDNNQRRQLIEEVLKNQCKQKKQGQGSVSWKNQTNDKNNKNNKQQVFNSNEFVFIRQTPAKYNRLNKAKSVQNINTSHFNTQKPHNYNNRQTSPLLPFLFSSSFYTCLSSQLRTRLKRCLLKQKQILYRDQHLQIGVKHSIKDEISFNMQIVITNITNAHQIQSSLNKLSLQIVSRNPQSQLIIKEKQTKNGNNKKLDNFIKRDGLLEISLDKQSLSFNSQWRIQLIVIVNDINFRQPVLMTLKYRKQSKNYQKNKQNKLKTLGLILPISKIKLLNPLPYNKSIQLNNNKLNSTNKVSTHKITKLIQLNPRVLTSLNKLITYYGQQYTCVIFNKNNINNQKHNSQKQQTQQIILNFQFLNKKISVAFRQIKHSKNQSINQSQSISIVQQNNTEFTQSKQLLNDKNNNNRNSIKHRQNSLVMLTVSSIDQSNHLILQSIADQFLFILSHK